MAEEPTAPPTSEPAAPPPDQPATEPVKKRHNPLLRLLVQLTVLAIVAGTVVAGAAAYLHDRFTQDGPAQAKTVVIVPRGTATSAIGDLLEAAGVVEDGQLFSYGVRMFARDRPLRAGELMATRQEGVKLLRLQLLEQSVRHE